MLGRKDLVPHLPSAGDQAGAPEIGRHLARDVAETRFLAVGDQQIAGIAQGFQGGEAKPAGHPQSNQHVAIVGDGVAGLIAKRAAL